MLKHPVWSEDWVIKAPGNNCHPHHIAPAPLGSSSGWWAHVANLDQLGHWPSHQALTCEPKPGFRVGPGNAELFDLNILGLIFFMMGWRTTLNLSWTEVFQACLTRKRQRGGPWTRWRDCLSAGLRNTRNTPLRAGGSVWGERSLGIRA